ncbi:MAG TPA: arginine repressor [Chloroflexota bacterium]|jgi:transcriptional regulator of arginine metabolism|nr:arginine repressor [Chloroflexota bacterium]
MKADSKQLRQRMLRRLVSGGEMHTQDELVDALRREGINVTQATVSRDIVELGLVRAAVEGRMIYTLPESISLNDTAVARRRLTYLMSELPLAFGESAALLVVRTAPGMANMVAVTLDACAFPEIVGTVAGDDTIFIALRAASDRDQVRRYLSDVTESDG